MCIRDSPYIKHSSSSNVKVGSQWPVALCTVFSLFMWRLVHLWADILRSISLVCGLRVWFFHDVRTQWAWMHSICTQPLQLLSCVCCMRFAVDLSANAECAVIWCIRVSCHWANLMLQLTFLCPFIRCFEGWCFYIPTTAVGFIVFRLCLFHYAVYTNCFVFRKTVWQIDWSLSFALVEVCGVVQALLFPVSSSLHFQQCRVNWIKCE